MKDYLKNKVLLNLHFNLFLVFYSIYSQLPLSLFCLISSLDLIEFDLDHFPHPHIHQFLSHVNPNQVSRLKMYLFPVLVGALHGCLIRLGYVVTNSSIKFLNFLGFFLDFPTKFCRGRNRNKIQRTPGIIAIDNLKRRELGGLVRHSIECKLGMGQQLIPILQMLLHKDS